MNEKLKYAPGKPGFGNKGDRGTDGNQGLSMYFTNFEDVTVDDSRIISRIQSNNDLWSGSNLPLPDGRLYVTGDLFIDTTGKVYEIDASAQSYVYKYANLNMGGLFVPLGTSSSEGYQRYFNSNTGSKYIVDNVYTASGAVDYTQAPSDIYSIAPVNFTRIEYTNIKPAGSLNAFTAYTIGSTDNKDGLAIVYDEANSKFRIGNVDDLGSIRNTNLVFDVSTLVVEKEDFVNTFTANTPPGTVLTNYEIDANSLFDPNFNDNPDSFINVSGVNDCSISWDLMDFANDPYVKGELHFYEKIFVFDGSLFRSDASIVRPLIFTDLEPTGSIKINGLKNTGSNPYQYVMKLTRNGWSRMSATGDVFSGTLSVSPATKANEPSTGSSIGFDVNSNIGWTPSILTNPSGMITSIDSSLTGFDGSIGVHLSANAGTQRTGVIRVTPAAGLPVDVSIHQLGSIIDVPITLTEINDGGTINPTSGVKFRNYTINAPALPVSNYVDVSLNVTMFAQNQWDPTVARVYPYGEITIRDSANVLLGQAVWNMNDTPALLYMQTGTYYKYLHLTHIAQSKFPLKVYVEADVETSSEPTVGNHETIITGDVLRINANSGTPVNIINTNSIVLAAVNIPL